MEGRVANLTITVDDEVLRRARVRALEQRTSVNAILAEHLERFARIRDLQEAAVQSLLSRAARSSADDKRRAARRGGRRWTRDELHER
jgi:hypothetical protein